MRGYSLVLFLLLALGLVSGTPDASFLTNEQLEGLSDRGQEFKYESDISRLMRVVVQHLYHDRDVFLRELVSNANDAIEKVRLVSLKDQDALKAAPDLNISITVDSQNGRVVIRDTGIGMTKDELTYNLGTIARSGTSEFLNKLEGSSGESGSSNLIGQFGLGFYSSFLVADRVTVASRAISARDDEQYIFESSANAEAFRIAPDPRGNTLGRGTEITLYLRDDAQEYLDNKKIKDIIVKHSEYGHAPIYLYDESLLATDGEDDTTEKTPWEHVNDRPPLWMREPSEISDEEYKDFYQKTFKAYEDPVAWTHFKGEAGSTTFRALIYIPQSLPTEYFTKSYITLESFKLFVRRVFITSDLGENYIPRYLDYVKIFVDADDLPLNVGRDSLQKSKAVTQIQTNLIRKTYDLLSSLSKASPNKYLEWYDKNAGSVGLKMGVLEDSKNRKRIVKLLRFETSSPSPLASDEPLKYDEDGKALAPTIQNHTSLDDYVLRRKQGQKQIYFFASVGVDRDIFLSSPFNEKLLARGYEVLFLNNPLDEAIVSTLVTYEGLRFQDVAKKGLKFGDEDENEDDEKELQVAYEPLTTYLLDRLSDSINEVAISKRLTESPCLIITDAFSWTANMERLMTAQSQGKDEFLNQFMRTQKRTFEINPFHPLIESLLDKVIHPVLDDDGSNELDELTDILWQTALIRSGFGVPDANKFFVQIEGLLRRYLGISKTAKADPLPIKPAPPIDTAPLRTSTEASLDDLEEANVPVIEKENDPVNWENWASIRDKVNQEKKEHNSVIEDKGDATKEQEAEPVPHDEL